MLKSLEPALPVQARFWKTIAKQSVGWAAAKRALSGAGGKCGLSEHPFRMDGRCEVPGLFVSRLHPCHLAVVPSSTYCCPRAHCVPSRVFWKHHQTGSWEKVSGAGVCKRRPLRLEYKYAIRTDYGYAAIEIIRLDREEAWYLLAQQKELLITPLDPDDVLPMQPTLPGERGRTLVGEATAVGRAAQLYEVQTDRRGRTEQWYEWVDVETGTVLKLVSRDRDWSFAYERIRWSPQPTEYFNEPPGYRKRAATVRGEQG